MRKLLLAAIVAAAFGAPAAHASLHGCIAVGGVVNVTSGSGGPVVTQPTVCDFAYESTDTYSGGGEFKIECAVNQVFKTIVTHAATDLPANQVPFSCDEGTTVKVTLSPGTVLAIGSTM